jgi:NADH-quinone oxidoreductase subunit E
MSDRIQPGSTNRRPRAPRPEELELRFSERAQAELAALLTHYPDKKSAILPVLWMAQREYGGHLPAEAIAEVAHRLGRSFAEVEGVATYYSMLNTAHPVGRHMIEVCTCLTCHMCGAYRMADHLKAKLGIGFGETTADGTFTLHEVECLNACDRAPLIQVGDQYHGPVDEAYLDRLIEELRGRPESSVVQLADQIVQVHLRATEKAAIGS